MKLDFLDQLQLSILNLVSVHKNFTISSTLLISHFKLAS